MTILFRVYLTSYPPTYHCIDNSSRPSNPNEIIIICQEDNLATDRHQQENLVTNRHQPVEQPQRVDPTRGSEDDTELSQGIQPLVNNSTKEYEDGSHLSGSGLSTFDPSCLATGDVHVFDAPHIIIINEYVEKHFCAVLDKEMSETQLHTIQTALLSAAGPLTCLWADLISNNTFRGLYNQCARHSGCGSTNIDDNPLFP